MPKARLWYGVYSRYGQSRLPGFKLTRSQGFDEFMNLVLYDAVEVKLVSKTREKEERISIGQLGHEVSGHCSRTSH